MIIVVGDKPSKKNKNPNIPFVGTQSYKRLLEWLWMLDVDVTQVILANIEHVKRHRPDWFVDVENPHMYTEILPEDKVIALGQKASKYLESIKQEHFKLPHPSGLNRQTNDKSFIKGRLKECRKYIGA